MIFTSVFLDVWGHKFKLDKESLEILSKQDLTSEEDLMEMSETDIDSLGLIVEEKQKLKRGIKHLYETTSEQAGTDGDNQIGIFLLKVATELFYQIKDIFLHP